LKRAAAAVSSTISPSLYCLRTGSKTASGMLSESSVIHSAHRIAAASFSPNFERSPFFAASTSPGVAPPVRASLVWEASQ